MLSPSTHATLAMDDQPGVVANVSLWQRNLVGIRGERLLAAKAAAGSVVLIDGISWGSAP